MLRKPLTSRPSRIHKSTFESRRPQDLIEPSQRWASATRVVTTSFTKGRSQRPLNTVKIYSPQFRKLARKSLRSSKISKAFPSTKSTSQAATPKSSADRQVLNERINNASIKSVHDAEISTEMATMMGAPQEEDEYKDAALSNILMCPDCQENPPNLTEEFSSGDVVCTSCGVVVCICHSLRALDGL